MIDTIRFERRYRRPTANSFPGWNISHRNDGDCPGIEKLLVLTHKQTGVRVEFKYGSTLANVEASLPHVLFGRNSELIVSQAQIQEALNKLERIVRQVTQPLARIGPKRKFKRVDLCWQVKGQVGDFIKCHQNLKHPEIDKWPSVYSRASIYWIGSQMSIKFYDKPEQMRQKLGQQAVKMRDVVRIEVRLSWGKLCRELGNGAPVTQLNLKRCYQVLREKILRLSPKTVIQLSSASQLPSRWLIYYLAVTHNWKIERRPAIDLLLANHSDKKRARLMMNLAAAQLRSYKIDWRKILPTAMPPVHSNGGFDFSL